MVADVLATQGASASATTTLTWFNWNIAVSVPERFIHWSLVAYINGFVQNCSNSSASALELLQSCNKPLIYASVHWIFIGSDNGLFLFDVKSLAEPLMCFQLDLCKITSINFEEKKHISQVNAIYGFINHLINWN